MAFTEKYLPVSRQQYFTYFVSDGDGAVAPDATFSEDFNPSFPFELDKIRIHLSTAHVSVVDFMVYLSHHLGSQYNQNLISVAMAGVQDALYQVEPTIRLHLTDTIHLSMIMSAVNVYGIEVSGWAITVAP